ncbi:MAG: histidine phosphatase family protein [Planctomycetes bacterium]|nr:histidine phosphatase family protein [Planctomycetota bacterium]
MKLNSNKFIRSAVFLAICAFLLFNLTGCNKVATIRLTINSRNSFVQMGSVSIKHNKQDVITVVIVRHAERTSGDALTVEGEKRAETLARLLRNSDLAAIFSTKTNRTIETVNNTSERLDIPIQFYSSTPAVASLIKSEYAGNTVLVVGHSNTVPPIIEALGVSPAPQIMNEFNNLFIVTIHNTGEAALTHLKYDIHLDL